MRWAALLALVCACDGTTSDDGADDAAAVDAATDAGRDAAPLLSVEQALERVDPFIGTGGLGFGYAALTPAAQHPNGMVRVGPDTTQDGAAESRRGALHASANRFRRCEAYRYLRKSLRLRALNSAGGHAHHLVALSAAPSWADDTSSSTTSPATTTTTPTYAASHISGWSAPAPSISGSCGSVRCARPTPRWTRRRSRRRRAATPCASTTWGSPSS